MILLTNGLVKTMAGPDIQDGQVLMNGGKIVAVGQNLDVPEGTEVIDCGGSIIAPGFIDAHTHLGLHENIFRWEGNDVNESTKPVTPDMRAIDGIYPEDEEFKPCLEAGITAACVTPGSANVIGGTACAIKLAGKYLDDMLIRDGIAMKAAFGENPKGSHGQAGRTPKTRMAVAALLRNTLQKAANYVREMDKAAESADGKKPTFDPELEAMVPVIRREIPLKIHAHRDYDILTAIRIAKEFNVKITLEHCTEGHLIVDKLVEAGYPVQIGPSLGNKSKPELKCKSFATPGILQRAGLRVSIITDSPVIPLHYLPLCAGLAIKAGMDEGEAWKAITINPARTLGLDDRIGSLEAGKDADVAVFTENPLRSIQATAKYVFVNGKKVIG